MGLNCSHDAFDGAYSAFNRFRQAVCHVTGFEGSYPPHYEYSMRGDLLYTKDGQVAIREGYDPDRFFLPYGMDEETCPGLWEFLTHSDCDGEISPEMCTKVADDLEKLVPRMKELPWVAGGHIERAGGFVAVLENFITGCRMAAKHNEPLGFY